MYFLSFTKSPAGEIHVKVSRYKLALSVICASYFLTFAHRLSVMPFYEEIMLHFDVGYTQAGMLMTVFALLYAGFLIPSGVLADRGDPVKLLAVAVLGTGLGGDAFWFQER